MADQPLRCFQIWRFPEGSIGLLSALDEPESEVFRSMGMELLATNECLPEEAQPWFVAWCEREAGCALEITNTDQGDMQARAAKALLGGGHG